MHSTLAPQQPSSLRNIYVGPAGWSTPTGNQSSIPRRSPKGFHEADIPRRGFSTPSKSTLPSTTRMKARLSPRSGSSRISANPRFPFTAKLWQRFTHETDATGLRDVARPSAPVSISRTPRIGSARVLLQFPFSFHNTPENLARPDKASSTNSAPIRWSPKSATLPGRTRVSTISSSDRNIGFCNIDQPIIGHSDQTQRSRHLACRLCSPSRPPLRHLVQRRSRIAAVRALQLFIFRTGITALGRAHRNRRRNNPHHVRRHQQSF